MPPASAVASSPAYGRLLAARVDDSGCVRIFFKDVELALYMEGRRSNCTFLRFSKLPTNCRQEETLCCFPVVLARIMCERGSLTSKKERNIRRSRNTIPCSIGFDIEL